MSDNRWRVLRAAEHRRMPWKNGLGETTEILIEPAGGTLDSFDYRLSMAHIEADGPFSCFPDVDRLLMVLEGRLELVIDGRSTVITADEPAVGFAGESAVRGVLLPTSAGETRPVVDLNLMVRRHRYAPRMYRHEIGREGSGADELRLTATTTLLLCRSAGVRVFDDDQTETLQPDDVLAIRASIPQRLRACCDEPAVLYIVELNPSRPSRRHSARR